MRKRPCARVEKSVDEAIPGRPAAFGIAKPDEPPAIELADPTARRAILPGSWNGSHERKGGRHESDAPSGNPRVSRAPTRNSNGVRSAAPHPRALKPSSPRRPRADAKPGERRDKTWRPGGEHKDPRQKYKDAKKAKWTRFKQTVRKRWESKQGRKKKDE